MNDEGLYVTAILAGGLRAAVPIFLAAIGETFTQRAGVINIGIEGIMLVGALTAVAVGVTTGSAWLGVAAAAAVGVILAAIHALICVWYPGNQVAAGIAMIIFGTGLSAFAGIGFVGHKFDGIAPWNIPLLGDIPVIGPVLFRHDPMLYLALAAVAAASFVLYRTHWGLKVRAVGDDADAASAVGIGVPKIRCSAVMTGGALAGLAGAYLSTTYAQLWLENMVAGRGLIAMALVVFGMWDPVRVFLGSLLFGVVSALQLHLQASGYGMSPYLLSMLPYLLSIAALIYATHRLRERADNVPAMLGIPYDRND